MTLYGLLLVGGATAASSTPPGQVGLEGAGGVRPGMTVAQTQSRWSLRLRLDTTFGSQCQSAELKTGATRGYVIFRGKRFAAVFYTRGARTDTGIQIGSPVSALRRAYGSRLRSEPDKYERGSLNYYVKRARRPFWELRFDVSPRGRVDLIAFGDRYVHLVEGCA